MPTHHALVRTHTHSYRSSLLANGTVAARVPISPRLAPATRFASAVALGGFAVLGAWIGLDRTSHGTQFIIENGDVRDVLKEFGIFDTNAFHRLRWRLDVQVRSNRRRARMPSLRVCVTLMRVCWVEKQSSGLASACVHWLLVRGQ